MSLPSRPRRSFRALLRPLLAVVGASAVAVSTLIPLASPAAAKEVVPQVSGDSYLCTGYAGCAAAGYDDFGYRERGGSMYWRMYSGHNCTNYVAYRMIQAGMSTSRPWDGSGNATNWGYAMSRITDQTPAVGAVAWWKANVPGAGSAGHIAVVQKVVSSTEIIVSEDSWGGDFHWRRITTSGSWPSGFIHFADARRAVTSTTAPALKGRARVGERLVAGRGAWNVPLDAARRQWLVDGVAVPGATERRFTLRPRDAGHVVSARVTATRSGYGPGTATTATSPRVARGRFATAEPTLQGTAAVGELLTVVPGATTPTPTRTAVHWYADGEPVPGATATTLRLTESLRGTRVRADLVLGRRAYVRGRTSSADSAPVAAPQIELSGPAVLEGSAVVGETLTVVPGGFAPRRARAAYTWLRDGRAIATPRTRTYRLGARDVGHRVSVRVDVVRDGWRRASQVADLAGPVRSRSTMALEATGRSRRAVVRATVSAPGVREVSGPAVVRIGRRSVATRVVDGSLRAVVEGLAPGTRTVVVRFAGSAVLLGARAEGPVTVLGARGVSAAAPRADAAASPVPDAQPTAQPTAQPAAQPTAQPAAQPTAQPAAQPTSVATAPAGAGSAHAPAE